MEMIYPIFNDGEDKENVQKISQEEKEKRELKNKRLNNQFVNLSKLKEELVENRHANLDQNPQMLPTIFQKFAKISRMLLFENVSS